ncbi:hypothetical protein MKEN_00282400 [Mycena kentingensis (nom. inval.)]|nr:hypothetical protein MKEN_00282400 [Mycena kentingensis (nom. inval.)]
MASFEYLAKIVIIGDSGVGKSCVPFFLPASGLPALILYARGRNLLTRYTRDEFRYDTMATIGVEFGNKSIEVDGKVLKAHLWDTAGQERYRALTSAYYRGAIAAILVYDITNLASFQHIATWLDELRAQTQPSGPDSHPMVFLLVGNKVDLKHLRAVSSEEGAAFAQAQGMGFIETSAADRENVAAAFEKVLLDTFHLIDSNAPQPPSTGAQEYFAWGQKTTRIDPSVDPNEKRRWNSCC